MNFSCKDYFELSFQKDFGLLIKRYLLNGLPVETFEDYAERFEIDLFRPWHRCVLTDGGLKHKELRIEKLEMLKSEYLCNSSIQRLKGLDSSAKKRANQLAEAFEECKETNRLSAEWGGGRVLSCETMDLALIFEQVTKERMLSATDGLVRY
ncbi:hypothetical protein [Paenibacillus harenae]|nr:hypothetical protein [Paenibacillus harenae]